MLRRQLLDDHLSWCRTKQKGLIHVKPENLRWTPFVPSPHVQVSDSQCSHSLYAHWLLNCWEAFEKSRTTQIGINVPQGSNWCASFWLKRSKVGRTTAQCQCS